MDNRERFLILHSFCRGNKSHSFAQYLEIGHDGFWINRTTRATRMVENGETKPSAPVHVESSVENRVNRFEKRKNDIITPTPTSIELFGHIDQLCTHHIQQITQSVRKTIARGNVIAANSCPTHARKPFHLCIEVNVVGRERERERTSIFFHGDSKLLLAQLVTNLVSLEKDLKFKFLIKSGISTC